MATAEKQAPPKIDINEFREYIHRLRTGEIFPLLRTGDDLRNTRPPFPDSYRAIVLGIEREAIRTGDIRQVQAKIKTAMKEVPGFADFCEEPAKKQEQKQAPKVEVTRSEIIVPPLPEGVALSPDASKGACEWHDEYVKFSRKWSPRSFKNFHPACGWGMLSTIASRRVAIELSGTRYTPLSIAVVARSSISAKSEAAKIYRNILYKAGFEWMEAPHSMTPQAMVGDMAKVESLPASIKYEKMPEEKRWELERGLAFQGQRGWFYEEFGQHMDSIMQKNGGVMAEFVGLIRVMDDCIPSYKRLTIKHQNQIVEAPYLPLLACMTPSDLKPYAGINSPLWTNGFFARFPFICPDERNGNRDEFPEGNLTESIPGELTNSLVKWHQKLGMREVYIEPVVDDQKNIERYDISYGDFPKQECIMTNDVRRAFYKYNNALLDIIEKENIQQFEGNYTRFHMIALRIAMLCASLENNGAIEMRHWAKGQEFAEMARRGLHSLWAQLNENGSAAESARLEEEIVKYVGKQEEWITARTMRRNRFYECEPKVFDDMLDRLVKAGDLITDRKGRMQCFSIPGEDKRLWPKSSAKAEGKE